MPNIAHSHEGSTINLESAKNDSLCSFVVGPRVRGGWTHLRALCDQSLVYDCGKLKISYYKRRIRRKDVGPESCDEKNDHEP